MSGKLKIVMKTKLVPSKVQLIKTKITFFIKQQGLKVDKNKIFIKKPSKN